MKKGSVEWFREQYKQRIKASARLSFRERLATYLTLTLEELEEINPTLYKTVTNAFPEMNKKDTLDTARMNKLMDKIFRESSTKALEMSYRLDGSFDEDTNEPDYELVENELEGIR